ncbi:methionyl-tRNA formyltransferase [Paenibacillaceae bacterium]|nr:methionyl-tRNA formyltransferase [Paenibacillaceae bacterium]
MRILFMGTPQFAVASLNVLLDKGYEVAAVVTQPDRPKGRKRELTPPPVKEAALLHGIPVLQPERLRSAEAIAQVAAIAPDLIVTAAYGQILPKAVLELPPLGCINVHGSLLPKYRGGAPIQRAIINGESKTGVTIMYMAEGLDTGDMITRIEVPIEDADTSGTLFEKLSSAGAVLLAETLPLFAEGRPPAVQQNEAEATYAPNLSRADELINWELSARALYNQVRGLAPMSGAFTYLNGEVFKVWGAHAVSDRTEALAPGTVIGTENDAILVQTGEGALALTRIQPAGKKAMSAADWLKGARIPSDTVLGGEQP